MKQKLRQIFKISLFATFFATLGCSEDETPSVHAQEHEEHLVKEIPFEELLKQSRFNTAYKKVSKNQKNSNALQAKTVMEEQYGFTIAPENAKVIETDSMTSYTLRIERDIEDPAYFENLVIQVDNNGTETRALILKYNLTSDIVPSEHGSANFTADVEGTPIIFDASESGSASKEAPQVCHYIIFTFCNYGGTTHLAGENCANTFDGPPMLVGCTGGGEVGGGGSDGSGPGGPGAGSPGGGSSGGGSNPYTPPVVPPVVTSPVVDQLAIAKNIFIRSLSVDQRSWLNNFLNPQKAVIYGYLDANFYSPAGSTFVKQYIQAILDTGLVFDFEKSLKSPSNIDESEIDTTTAEGAKFKCIYETLTTSPSFKQLFINTFGQSDRLNIKFEVAENLPANVNGNCHLRTITINGRTVYNNLIRINKDILNNSKSDIFIARVIIHEFIHAYLNIKAANCNNGATLPYLNNLQLEELIGTFYQGFNCHINVNGQSQSQHDFVFNNMTPSFISILSEIKDLLISPAHQLQASQQQYYNPVTNSLENFSWNDLFYNMALSGLHQTQSFQTTIQSDTQRNGRFAFYTSLSQMLTKNCQ